jgi:hypothetical protein
VTSYQPGRYERPTSYRSSTWKWCVTHKLLLYIAVCLTILTVSYLLERTGVW